MPIHTFHGPEPAKPGKLLFGMPLPPQDVEQLPEGISLCMIVKNEERFLEACLRSVEGIVDEINIVDTGSTDRTLEIAQKFGARIEHREWRSDFAWARNEALAMATKRWTLVLDGDEEIAAESRRALLDLRTVPSHMTVLYCRIHNDIDEHGASGMMSHSLPRVFPTNPRIRYQGVIHETLAVDGGATRAGAVISSIRILHKGYRLEIIGAKKKQERNAPLLQRATEINAEDAYAWFNYGNYLLGGDEWEDGVEALERMVQLERGKEMKAYVPLGYVTLATAIATKTDEYERALGYIDECLELSPGYVLAIYGKGEILARAKRYDEAREWFEKAIKTKDHEDRYNVIDEEIVLWKAQYNIATTYLNEQRFEDAISWLEEARKNKPDIWSVNERLAFSYERAKRYFDAEIVLREAFERFGDENSAATYINYLVRRQRLIRALEIIEEALPKATPAAASALNTAAAAIVIQNKSGDPVAYLRAALEHTPGNGLALAMLDRIFAERGDELSRARLRREELDAPLVSPVDFLRRSNRYLEEHRLEDAARVAEDGVVVSGASPALLFNLGLALAQLEGRSERALEVLSCIVSGDPQIVETGAFLRASLLEKAGRAQDALEVIDAAFGAQPSQDDALMLRARLLEGLGRSGEAEGELRAALTSGRKRVGVELAGLMLRAGRYAEAAGVAGEALATG